MRVDTIRAIEILEHYGPENQKIKAAEELAELLEAIMKDISKGTAAGILGEVADVYIMLTQLELIYSLDPDDLRAAIEYKLDRQISRMSQEMSV